MKFFAFIMAVLVLALSVMPCADGASAMKVSKSSIVTPKQDNGGNDIGDDNCSPFCQCSCCAGFSISHPIISVEFVLTHSSSRFFIFSSNSVIGIASTIWQPPQLRS